MSALTDAVAERIRIYMGCVVRDGSTSGACAAELAEELRPILEAAEEMRDAVSYDGGRLAAEADWDAAVAALTTHPPSQE